MRVIIVPAFLALLLLSACGGEEPAAPAGGTPGASAGTPGETPDAGPAVMAEVRQAVDGAIAVTKTFNEAAEKATTPVEFAAALTALAAKWGGYGKDLHDLTTMLPAVGLEAEDFDAEVNRLDPHLAKREELFEQCLEKWAEAPGMRAAIEGFVTANEAWEGR